MFFKVEHDAQDYSFKVHWDEEAGDYNLTFARHFPGLSVSSDRMNTSFDTGIELLDALTEEIGGPNVRRHLSFVASEVLDEYFRSR